ncbi:hypothetical protein Bca4012_045796 [Brassica carinata]
MSLLGGDCQIAHDCVDTTVSLLDLLHLFKSHGLAKREANLPSKEPDVVPVSFSHEVKTVVIRTIWDQERSQGVVVRRDLDRSSTNQFSFCRPLPQLMDALMEEVNLCHDVKLVVILLGKKCSALLNLAKLPQS